MKTSTVIVEIVWNLFLAALGVSIVYVAPGIFPPGVALFSMLFVGLAAVSASQLREAQ